MRIERWLETSAARYPEKVAVVTGGTRTTYEELRDASDRLAATLVSTGVRPGDRVVLFLDNGVEAIIGLFAVLRAGGVFVMVNPTTKSHKLAYILNDSEARILITQARIAGAAMAALEENASVSATIVVGEPAQQLRGGIAWADAVAPSRREMPSGIGIDADLAMLVYTSGSTGFPKGVMMTHRNVETAASSITTYLENTPDDVILSVLPLSFDYGLYQALMTVLIGATLVLESSFVYPQPILGLMARENVTGFPIVPTMAAVLLQMRGLSADKMPRLRYITNTAAALPPAHIERLQALFPRTRIFSMYGLTECKRCTYLPPEELSARPGSVGKAIPNTEVYLVNDDGERLAPGESGELVVRGGHVMQGYWNAPEATARMLRPGPNPWERVLYTGDLFRTDDEGFLYFIGRKDDIIKSRGEKVSPKEVENVLYLLPGVKEAAVVGVPDPILGMALKAVLVAGEPSALSDRQVIAHCAKHLEDYMVPRLVEFRTELPKTDSGKIRRSEVQAEALGQRGDVAAAPCPNADANPAISPCTVKASAASESFSARVLDIDVEREITEICDAIRLQVPRELRRRGAVLGLSGGIDSSVVAALCVRALGPQRVLGLLMPEGESHPESLTLGKLVAEQLGIEAIVEDITPMLKAAGCYERRDAAIRKVLPDIPPGCRSKMVISNPFETPGFSYFSLVVEQPDGTERRVRLTADAYLAILASTNIKQRTRKLVEYYHADRRNYAVVGTPNRLEYDQGFFVKNGDGAADLKPIAHLYKTQVYRLADALDIPQEIRMRISTTDTYSLPQTQEEFYFPLPHGQMDLCLYGLNHEIDPAEVAGVAGLTPDQVRCVYSNIGDKRRATAYLHRNPMLVRSVAEVTGG